MINVSELYSTPPIVFVSSLQQIIYTTLQHLNIAFERIDTDNAVSMEDCIAIDQKLMVKTVKTLFLCNRQKNNFYLLVTKGDKPFITKNFSQALGISRVSFAPPDLLLSMLGTPIGGASVLSIVLDKQHRVKVVIDKEVLDEEWFGCNDGTPNCYLKIKTELIINKFLQYAEHLPYYINL